ncbi:hypothetical protein A9P82_12095 [Arachidicoccus ginsenosidimutans]|uniref:hypothetical protein n=1 Tax=Arachidicoccus sp. BS20 TaxID=1850526 RepID=UPI0007F04FFE|nr:hypothetical protein [Arachidicoccus sp. BS20]ANI89962.1 hypothetical protein A9P82_12095 [Arachidicoccus sp. BS20]
MKKFICLCLFLLLLASCSKKDNPSGNADSGKTDMTKYYIVSNQSFNGIMFPAALIFNSNAQGVYFKQYNSSNFEYKVQNGLLQINFGDANLSWKLDNETLSDCSSNLFTDYTLEKIPDSDPFAGNIYTGTEYSANLSTSDVNKVPAISNILAFKSGQFTLTVISQQGIPSTISGDYTKEVYGVATANVGGEVWRFYIQQGKLLFTCYNANAEVVDFGTYTKN